jgi:hypothetical protein
MNSRRTKRFLPPRFLSLPSFRLPPAALLPLLSLLVAALEVPLLLFALPVPVLAAPAALEVLLPLLSLLVAALEVVLPLFALLVPPPFVTVNLLQSS